MIDTYNLPKLKGSTKQIEWANDIREKFYNTFNNINGIDIIISSEISSKFWIDNRKDLNEHFIQRYINTIKPEKILHKGIVEIFESYENDKKTIRLNYNSYDEQFEEIVKNNGYIEGVGIVVYGTSVCAEINGWYRNLDETTGEFVDRAAEIGDMLLKNGFSIFIINKIASEKAITKEYKKEHLRWIKANRSYFVVRWQDNDTENNKFLDFLIKIDGKIQKSKTNRTIVYVKFEKYKQLLEFAKNNDFKLTEKAKNLVKKESMLCQE